MSKAGNLRLKRGADGAKDPGGVRGEVEQVREIFAFRKHHSAECSHPERAHDKVAGYGEDEAGVHVNERAACDFAADWLDPDVPEERYEEYEGEDGADRYFYLSK